MGAKVPNLSQLLRFRSQKVIRKFSHVFGISLSESEIIFQDLLRYLWLGRHLREKHPKARNPMVFPWLVIDEMWHVFLLHSAEYERFCRRYFGAYIHHTPSAPGRKPSKKPSSLQKARFGSEMKAKMREIHDLFGPQVMSRWFGEYPKKYSKRSLLKRQLDQLVD